LFINSEAPCYKQIAIKKLIYIPELPDNWLNEGNQIFSNPIEGEPVQQKTSNFLIAQI